MAATSLGDRLLRLPIWSLTRSPVPSTPASPPPAGTGAVWALDGGTLAVTHTISLSDSFPGIDVDPATGTFYVTDQAGVYAVDGSGCPIAQISAAAAADVTVDSTAGTVLGGEK